MGQSATLYEIDQVEFDRLRKDHRDFSEQRTIQHQVFEKNHEGLRFLLEKFVAEKDRDLMFEIFYPSDSLGMPDEQKMISLLDSDDFLYVHEDAVNYLTPEKVQAIWQVVKEINEAEFLATYDPDELNSQGVYPYNIWHRNERSDLAFNRTDIQEAFRALRDIFKDASVHENYIVAFVG